jgi:GxxExxY protein
MRDIQSRTEVPIPLFYKGVDTGKHYKIDLLVEAEVIVEIKAVETLHPTCQSQIISHLTLANKPLGYLVNFNVVKLKDGFKRYVNNF